MNQTVTFKIGFKPINLFAVPAFILFCLLMVGNLNAQNVTVAGAVAGNGTYADLGSAFTALNGDPQTGATITVSIVGNTTEAASAILNQGAWTSLTISPSGGAARTISGAITGVLVDLNGADNVTINGLNTGGNSLIIDNTATGASNTIRFINDASNNTITKCTLKGAASTASNGVVIFSTGTTTGNDNNNINNCDITASGANLPINGIYAQGTSAAIDNSGNTINANNIYDFFSAGSTSIGLHLNATGAGNSAWTITNNKFYQTATRTYTTANTHQAIFVGSGVGYTVSGNQIGGANASGTGTYTMTSTVATRFIGIGLGLTAGAPASSVQGNTVYSLSLATSSGASTTNGVICGINVTSGDVNIGTTTGNTIGSMSGTGSLVATPTTTQGAIVGINCSSTGTINISNNQMGAWSSSGATAAVAGGVIGITISGAATSMTINNNTIGNATANNMQAGILGTTTGSSVGGSA